MQISKPDMDNISVTVQTDQYFTDVLQTQTAFSAWMLRNILKSSDSPVPSAMQMQAEL